MANKKTSKKPPKKKAAPKRVTPVKKRAKNKSSRTPTPKKRIEKRKPSVKKSVPKKPAKQAVTKKTTSRKAVGKSTATAQSSKPQKRVSTESQVFETDVVAVQQRRSRSGGQSGDLQGLSGVEGADSESVDELLEEGNAFEADVVAGVQQAGDADEQEVHTHEVPEDDVPGEYLDED